MDMQLTDGEIVAEAYVPLTKAEVKNLAVDLLGGNIVGSWMLREDEQGIMGTIFLPMLFMSEIQHKQWQVDGVVHVYGHNHDSTGRCINGWPTLMKIRGITRADLDRVLNVAKILNDLEAE